MRIRKCWWVVGSLGLLGIGCVLSLIPVLSAANVEYQIARAEKAMRGGHPDRVRSICIRLLADYADSLDAEEKSNLRRLASQAAFALGDLPGGLQLIRPELRRRDATMRNWLIEEASRWARSEGRLADAETALEAVLEADRDNAAALEMLTALQLAQGRWNAAARSIYHQLRLGQSHRPDLLFLANPSAALPSYPNVQSLQKRAETDPLVRFAHLRTIAEANPQEQKTVLQNLVRQSPHCVEMQAYWGWILAQLDDDSDFERWRNELPAQAWKHPEVWYAAAMRLEEAGEHRSAIRCCWESLRRRSDQRDVYRLLVTLLEQEEDPRAAEYRKRSETLQKLAATAADLAKTPDHLQSLRRMMTLCRDLGRYWEARAWAQQMALCDANDVTMRELEREIRGHLADDLPPVVESFDPVVRFRLDSYPLPQWTTLLDDTVARSSAIASP